MGRLIGYARVSTAEQNLQLDALKKAGCVKVFEDKASGARSKRPRLDACVAALAPGDTSIVIAALLVGFAAVGLHSVWRFDRLKEDKRRIIQRLEEAPRSAPGLRHGPPLPWHDLRSR